MQGGAPRPAFIRVFAAACARGLLNRPATTLGVLGLLLHVWANAHYGIFRDELYYIVCGWRLAWGFMDQPPLSPAIAAASHALFGTWLPGFRLVPALCFAATVMLTVQLAKRLAAPFGPMRFAPWLAGGTVFAAGTLQVTGVLLTTDPLQPPLWTACTYAMVRAIRDGRRFWWLGAGALGGIAFLGKYTIVFHLGSLTLALLVTPQRRALAHWQPWAGAALMAVIAAPNIAWQASYGFPFLAHMHDLAAHHTEAMTPLVYAGQQILQMNPVTFPVWGAGLAALLVWRPLRDLRWIGVGYLMLMVFGQVSHGKTYYMAPAYPGLLAAGAVALQTWLSRAAACGLCAVIAAGGTALAPLALPVLPPASLAAYLAWLGLKPGTGERVSLGALPQYFADMFGWQAFADSIHAAWRALPPADQARTVFVGRNYGEAAAVEVLGHGPDAVSMHQSYWYWGPKGHDGSVLLDVGEDRAHLLTIFATVDQVGTTPGGWGMPYEVNAPIWLCRGMRVPLGAWWTGHFKDN